MKSNQDYFITVYVKIIFDVVFAFKGWQNLSLPRCK
jgi:hypothetical protein